MWVISHFFDCNGALKSETVLDRATRTPSLVFNRFFLDFGLIVTIIAENPDPRQYVIANGIKNCIAL